jgi:hypothetical protein
MRLAICGLSVVLAGVLLGQASKPAQRRAGQNETRVDEAAEGGKSIVLRGSPREAAECTQGVLQHERWTIVRSTSGQLRAFRYVSAEELERIAQGPLKGEARWSRGRVDLFATFAAAARSSTRAELRARILAEAETPEPALRPTNLRPLASSGALEAELVAALKARCQMEAKPSR